MQPIFSHTFEEELLTRMTGFRVNEACSSTISPNDIHIGPTQLADITKLLDDVAFRVNAPFGVAAPHAPVSHLVSCLGQNVSAFDYNRLMNEADLFETQANGLWMDRKPFQNVYSPHVFSGHRSAL